MKPGNNLRLIGAYWILFFVTFLAAAIFADLLRILDHFFNIFPSWIKNHYTLVKLVYAGLVFLLISIICICGFRTVKNPQITDLDISINKEVDDLKIIAAGDIHLGYIIRTKHLEEWVEMINDEDPDLVLLVGDIFDRFVDFNDIQSIQNILKKLKSRYGVYAVPGNHEYYVGIDNSIKYLQRSGITVLRDSAITVDNRFIIIGRDDVYNRKRRPLDSIIATVDSSIPVILMDHSPNINGSVKFGVDVHLSGHLHNGQIFPFNIILKKMWGFIYGYRKVEDTHFYVTSGLGITYLPIRFGTKSEIVRIKLHN